MPTDLLRILSDHYDEREVVHPQGGIKELVRIHEEDNIFDRVFYEIGIDSICREINNSLNLSAKD